MAREYDVTMGKAGRAKLMRGVEMLDVMPQFARSHSEREDGIRRSFRSEYRKLASERRCEIAVVKKSAVCINH